MDLKAFTAEAKTLLYLNTDVLMSSARQFQQFHDLTLQNGLPMATVFITQRDDCRECGKPLLIGKNSHPVIIYLDSRYLFRIALHQELQEISINRTLRILDDQGTEVL